jgi:hypothetical protein
LEESPPLPRAGSYCDGDFRVGESLTHTLKVIAGGFALLGLCLLLGRVVGGPVPAVGLTLGAKLFIPLWLVASGVNLWVGVSKAGYTVAEEAPIFLLVFAVPATVALLLVWKFSRG